MKEVRLGIWVVNSTLRMLLLFTVQDSEIILFLYVTQTPLYSEQFQPNNHNNYFEIQNPRIIEKLKIKFYTTIKQNYLRNN